MKLVGTCFGDLWCEVRSGVSGLRSTTNWDPDWPEFPRLEAGDGGGEEGKRLAPRGTQRTPPPPGADDSHHRGRVCLEEKPKYISELVKLLRSSWESVAG